MTRITYIDRNGHKCQIVCPWYAVDRACDAITAQSGRLLRID